MSSTTPNNFLGELDCRYLNGRQWIILAPFEFHLIGPYGSEFVRVNQGEITDFASIPRPIKLIWPSPGGAWDKPAVIHDHLYALPYVRCVEGNQRRLTRAECDEVFNEGMAVTGTHRVTRWAMFRGVRVGGGLVGDRYREADELRRRV